MAEMEPKILEAQKKLSRIIKKAQSLGIQSEHLANLATSRKLNYTFTFRNPRIYLISAIILPLVLVVYGLGLQNSAYFIYQDWKNGMTNPQQCVVFVPDTWYRIFRPPVPCSVCEGVTQVDKISKMPVNTFEEKYAYSGRPVIITDATDNWTAPQVFSFEFFKSLYKDKVESLVAQQCQFFPYKTSFRHLGEFFNMTTEGKGVTPWYVGWSNCDLGVTEVLRQHYQRPYFLPRNAEGKRLDWIFMGSKGYGAPMHVDNVEYPSWQAQLRGKKQWRLEPPPECFYTCHSLEVIVEAGEIIVLDTNRWYHSTEIVSEEISITIGAEYD